MSLTCTRMGTQPIFIVLVWTFTAPSFHSALTWTISRSDKDKDRCHKYGGGAVLPGIWIGYHHRAGGSWSGDVLVCDQAEIEMAEHPRDINIKRFNHKEVNVVKIADEFLCLLVEGNLKQPGTDVKKRKKLIKPKPKDGEEPSAEQETEESEIDNEPAGGNSEHEDQPDLEDQDTWTVTDDLLIRHQKNPRTRLYYPVESDLPIPLKYIDIMRVTETDIEDKVESRITDHWINAEGNLTLSSPWVGRTMFHLLRPNPPAGYKWIAGRLTKVQETTRPDDIWPEMWNAMSKKHRNKAVQAWNVESKRRENV